ncbi:SDR family NAD(P)-dependent oxidoreductase [Nisaea nitritireducens]|uniref:SDR family NAD(P)-dependent oxidoreductase n=1 Tax=Nisaea nitritireducens TaxID=568392 RepID=UPI001D02EC62|nr:SDR family NAD(P)-dependent oxidoreductase [Nisaea nitritireducens]
MAELFCQGYDIPSGSLFGAELPRVHLPRYPFQRDDLGHGKEGPPPERFKPPKNTRATPASDAPLPEEGTLLFRPVWEDIQTVPDRAQAAVRHIFKCGNWPVSLPDLERPSIGAGANTVEARYLAAAEHLLELLKTEQAEGRDGETLIQLLVPSEGQERLFAGLSGLLQTACREMPSIRCQVIEVDGTISNDELDHLIENADGLHLRHHEGSTRKHGWREVVEIDGPADGRIWKDNGVYLITGGLGGLGQLFAEEILSRTPSASVLLSGRSDAGIDARMAAKWGDRIGYRKADVACSEDVATLFDYIHEIHGHLDGILHCAGVLRDGMIVGKPSSDLAAVFAGKVDGSLNLLNASAKFKPEFLTLFASCSGVTGNIGQADYAAASAFQDVLAEGYGLLRNRPTRVVSIDWPLWGDGGMTVDENAQADMKQSTGLTPLSRAQGLAAFYHVMRSNEPRLMVLNGVTSRLRGETADVARTMEPPAVSSGLQDQVREALEAFLADRLKLPLAHLRPHDLFDSYGIDSIVSTDLANDLRQHFPDVTRTMFYEFPTLQGLSAHLAETAPERARHWVNAAGTSTSGATEPIRQSAPSEALRTVEARADVAETRDHDKDTAVAIIGLSGRFPGAETLNAFWQNLENGVEAITEVPADRWNWRETGLSDGTTGEKGRWGAFLEDVHAFDPLFFKLTPKDAAQIDPQERLFLEQCWLALEQSGYAPSTLPLALKERAGVFAGITKSHIAVGPGPGAAGLVATSYSGLVNRVSHHLDFRGTSLAIDTMCSSSLVAIHEACEYLRHRGGKLAIAGGVNLYLAPASFDALNASHSLAKGRHCQAFRGNDTGFVPGEAVGAVVLKPLADALRDNDPIIAVISGSAVGHAGKSGAFGAPNPSEHATVIRQALATAGLEPSAISYFESSANGQSLADAAELAAVRQVFGTEGQGGRIGSVKPNIGHAEAASGMAQLSKVLLAMRHRRIPPTLLNGIENSEIDFKRLPFDLIDGVEGWSNSSAEGTLRAGISSVGAGGVHAHLIVESFAQETVDESAPDGSPYPFVFSAATPERLTAVAETWIRYLKTCGPVDMRRLASTLTSGREPMAARLAIVAASKSELAERLERWLAGDGAGEWCWHGDETASNANRNVETASGGTDLAGAAQSWALGKSGDLRHLFEGAQPIGALPGLPGYPFERRQCKFESVISSPAMKDTHSHENKAAEFYALGAAAAAEEFEEDYLTFAPFPERVPGFSFSRVCCNPDNFPDELAVIKERQKEMRDVLFGMAKVARCDKILDFGCGHGTDLIQLAKAHGARHLHGYTITKSQAELCTRRIQTLGLQSRVTVFHRDSGAAPFVEPDYDLIFGIEVSFHIRDKAALFSNIAASLAPDGEVLLIDYIANTRGAIFDPRVEVTVPTQDQWSETLAEAGLAISEIVDVSREISNCLYDPDIEGTVRSLPEVARDTWRNYANQSAALERGQISYVLMKLNKSKETDAKTIRDKNRARVAAPALYADVAPGERPNNDADPKALEAKQASVVLALREIFASSTGLTQDDLDKTERFAELGIGSVNAVELVEAINQRFDLYLPTSVMFVHDTIAALSAFISEEMDAADLDEPEPSTAIPKSRIPHGEDAIAVVGLSCRTAGASDHEQLWELISEGKTEVGDLSADWQTYVAANSQTSSTCRYGAMSDVEAFDPLFFRLSPREAEHMDAHQRLLLEESYHALEDAGYAPSSLAGRNVGCYLGLIAGSVPENSEAAHLSMLGSDTSIASGRLAHLFDFQGPVVAVNTACSSSLVALDLAVEALKGGKVDMALAGGATVWTHPAAFISLIEAGMQSPTGTCRPFDNDADGTVFGDGIGIVVLKRLADAEADGDNILGVIRGAGTNQDGRTSAITVPNFKAQNRLQTSVYKDNEIDPSDIGYVECHGTGTKLGDPVELHALTESFGSFTEKAQYCAVGSLKANVGHTAAAAGVLGLIKVLLCLRNRMLPPAVNFAGENEHVDFRASPFYVNRDLKAWPENRHGSRMAALNSFGYSGTNAHLVVEEYHAPDTASFEAQSGPLLPEEHLIPLSGQREVNLKANARALASFIRRHPEEIDLTRLAFTLQTGRDPMDARLALVVKNKEELLSALDAFDNGKIAECKSRLFLGAAKSGDQVGHRVGRREASELHPNQIAEIWVNGGEVDWLALYGSGKPRPIDLPTYRFSKEHYPLLWRGYVPQAEKKERPVSEAPSVTAVRSAPASAPIDHDTPRIMRFREEWMPVGISNDTAARNDGLRLLCILNDPDARSAFERFLMSKSPKTEIKFVSSLEEELELSDPDAVLDLSALENQEKNSDPSTVASMLNQLKKTNLKSPRILLVGEYRNGLERCYLESWIGFERSIGLAWPGAKLSVLIADAEEGDGIDEHWFARVWAELGNSRTSSALYQGDERFESRVRAVATPTTEACVS